MRKEVEAFSQEPLKKIASLQRSLSRGTFSFGKAKAVPIPKVDASGKATGKIRPLVLAPLETRIVQRAILNVLADIPKIKSYVETPFSFGGLKKGLSDEESSVPGAIKSVLDAIENGATHYAKADISNFFTRIPKARLFTVIGESVADPDLLELFRQAISVELENLATIKQYEDQFPTHEIGVAQGNSLSPLLGNIALSEFDQKLNNSDCRCIRYIDDFILIGSNEASVTAALRLAKSELKKLGMPLEGSKSSTQAIMISKGIDFLGIELRSGIIRPSKATRTKLLEAVQSDVRTSITSMRSSRVERMWSLASTLKRVDGRIYSWRKQYWFCNDKDCFKTMNSQVSEEIRKYLGIYVSLRDASSEDARRSLLGVTDLRETDREPFRYPSVGRSA